MSGTAPGRGGPVAVAPPQITPKFKAMVVEKAREAEVIALGGRRISGSDEAAWYWRITPGFQDELCRHGPALTSATGEIRGGRYRVATNSPSEAYFTPMADQPQFYSELDATHRVLFSKGEDVITLDGLKSGFLGEVSSLGISATHYDASRAEHVAMLLPEGAELPAQPKIEVPAPLKGAQRGPRRRPSRQKPEETFDPDFPLKGDAPQ